MRLTESQLRNLIRQSVKRALVEAEGDADPSAAGALDDLTVASGPSDTVKFLNGPGADPRVRALIKAGTSDGAPDDEAASVSEGSATIGELVPTQIEIELTKSIAYPLAKFEAMKKMISGLINVNIPGKGLMWQETYNMMIKNTYLRLK
jgi:hypothetical protein